MKDFGCHLVLRSRQLLFTKSNSKIRELSVVTT